jgi:hypothetical protein
MEVRGGQVDKYWFWRKKCVKRKARLHRLLVQRFCMLP